MTAIAQLPGLTTAPTARSSRTAARSVGSALIGQAFTDANGKPLPQYFQSRPSAAGDAGYDPTATARVQPRARRASSTRCPTRRRQGDAG